MKNRTTIRSPVVRGPLMALALFGAVGCGSTAVAPDLAGLYNDVARYHDELTNPVIVIPGILGTKLVDPGSGRTVWGAFGGSAANPQKLDGARLTGLPMREGASLNDLRDDVVPNGVLDTLKVKMMGLPFQLKAYFQILATLGAGGYRDSTLAGSIDYGDEHFTCFQFDYDWRRDNVENAQRLHDFILEKRAYILEEQEKRFGISNPDVRFNIIAHSMGGLLTRYYLRYGAADLPDDGSLPPLTWEGSRYVERAVLVGTPSAGSLDALQQLVVGRKFGPLTPKYEPALLGTFPAVYQLLPRVRHAAVRDSVDADRKIDFMNADLWVELGWGLADEDQDPVLQMLLPDVPTREGRRRVAVDHLEKSLARARQLSAALDQSSSPPRGTSLYLIAGDSVPTAKHATADLSTGDLRITSLDAGDGTVLRSSALMDERVASSWSPRLVTPIDWTDVMFLFSDHLGMTKDPSFSDNVLYLLLEQPRRPSVAKSVQ